MSDHPPPRLACSNLQKLSLLTLGQPLPPLFCKFEPPCSWPTTHYSWFCQFECASARIGKIKPILALIFASSSAQVPELEKSSLSCLLDCPPPSFLHKCSNWQN